MKAKVVLVPLLLFVYTLSGPLSPTAGKQLAPAPLLVSASMTGAPSAGWSTMPAISEDGRIVAYVSTAADLVPGDTNNQADVFIYDRSAGVTQRVSVSSQGG